MTASTGNILHIVGQTIPASITLLEAIDKDVSGIIKRICYINYTNQDMTVIERSGLRYCVPHASDKYTQQFIIRTEYIVPNHSFNDLRKLLIHVEQKPGVYPDLIALKECFFIETKDRPRDRYRSVKLIIDCPIDQSALSKLNGIYIINHDIVIVETKNQITASHPCDLSVITANTYISKTRTNSGISFFIDIIDNNNQIGDRYLYVSKRIFKTSPIKDETKKEGVYFGTVEYTDLGEEIVNSTYFSLDEADEKLGLYRTREEALSAGDIKSVRQEEIQTLTHRNNVMAIELQEKTQAYKLENERLKSEATAVESDMKLKLLEAEERIKSLDNENKTFFSRLDAERAYAEREYIRLKNEYDTSKLVMSDHYDRISGERKNTIEMVKFIATCLATGLSIWAIVAKSK